MVCWWLRGGAGAGLAVRPMGASGIFPETPLVDRRMGACVDADFDTCAGAAECVDDEVIRETESHAECGWLVEYATVEGARSQLGPDVVVSAPQMLRKGKQGRTKKRFIIGLRRSGISTWMEHTCRSSQMRGSTWSARRRAVPGDIGAPPSARSMVRWLGLGRWRPCSGACRASSGRTATVLTGQQSHCDMLLAMIVLIWRLCGFPLASAKAQHSSTVMWVGCSLCAG